MNILGTNWRNALGLLLLVAVYACMHKQAPSYGDSELLYQWEELTWQLPNDSIQDEGERLKINPLALATVAKRDHHGQMYLAVPRWQLNTPATLNKLIDHNGYPQLEAFPNWAFNDPKYAKGLKSVVDFVIDELGMMWILDQGQVKGAASVDGDQKLIKWDLEGNKLMDVFVINNEIAAYASSFLNGLAIDTQNGFAYIADAGVNADPLESALIVLDINSRKFRRVLHQHVSVQDEPDFSFSINNKPVWEQSPMRTGLAGLALSPNKNTLYYCPLSTRKLYAIDTRFLQDFDIPLAAMPNGVICLGNKGSCSAYLYCHTNGDVYYSMLENNGIGFYRPSTKSFDTTSVNMAMSWPSSIASSPDSNWLLVSHNNLHLRGKTPVSAPKQGLWQVYIGADLTKEQIE